MVTTKHCSPFKGCNAWRVHEACLCMNKEEWIRKLNVRRGDQRSMFTRIFAVVGGTKIGVSLTTMVKAGSPICCLLKTNRQMMLSFHSHYLSLPIVSEWQQVGKPFDKRTEVLIWQHYWQAGRHNTIQGWGSSKYWNMHYSWTAIVTGLIVCGITAVLELYFIFCNYIFVYPWYCW